MKKEVPWILCLVETIVGPLRRFVRDRLAPGVRMGAGFID